MAERSQAVQYFVPDNPVVAKNTRTKIETELASRREQLSTGAASDWGDYQKRVGVCDGLKEAIAILDDVEKEQSK